MPVDLVHRTGKRVTANPPGAARSRAYWRIEMTPKEIILSQAIPHVCTRDGCGDVRKHRPGLVEIPSASFIDATQATRPRAGVILAPD